VPTVAVVNTPVDIGCIDEAGTVLGAARSWYSLDAGGALRLSGEIVASLRLGDFAATTFAAVVANIGPYATTAVRDVAPSRSFCATDRVAVITLHDGAEVVVTAWRSVAAASPQWIPSEVPFAQTDDSTFVSQGTHVVSVLKVARDGTSVAVTAYGRNAREAFEHAAGADPRFHLRGPVGPVTGLRRATDADRRRRSRLLGRALASAE